MQRTPFVRENSAIPVSSPNNDTVQARTSSIEPNQDGCISPGSVSTAFQSVEADFHGRTSNEQKQKIAQEKSDFLMSQGVIEPLDKKPPASVISEQLTINEKAKFAPGPLHRKIFDPTSIHELPLEVKDTRRRCIFGCIPRRIIPRTICLTTTAAVLITIGVLIYVYFPRMPVFQVLEVNMVLGKLKFDLPPGSDNLNEMTIAMDLPMTISALNNNKYPFYVQTIELTSNLAVNKSRWEEYGVTAALSIPSHYIGLPPIPADEKYVPSLTPEIGTSSYKDLELQPGDNVTFPMTFHFKFHPDEQVGLLKDPVFFELYDACGMLGDDTSRPMVFTYTVHTYVKGWSAFGLKYPINGMINIFCPATTSQLKELRDVYSNSTTQPNVYDELKRIFGYANEE